MKKFALCIGASAALMIASAPAMAQGSATVPVSTGKTVYDSEGHKVGRIYRVTSEGNLQIILNGRMVTVLASTLSDTNGKITTSVSRADLTRMR